MGRSSDVVIGLDVGEDSLAAAAFTCDGRPLGEVDSAIAVREGVDGAAEVELGEVWKAAVGAMVRLRSRLPNLAKRTVALAITGAANGTWLIDGDGDQVMPALLGRDRRAGEIAARWWRSGISREVREITGTWPSAGLQSAQLAWLTVQRPAAVDAATTALHGRGWLHFCCTGERAADRVEAAAAFGDFRTASYDQRVPALLGLDDVRRLLPEIAGDDHGTLLRSAAAAMGLAADTPVVLAPPDLLCEALAAGLPSDRSDPAGLGVTIHAPRSVHLRGLGDARRTTLPEEPAASVWPDPIGDGCYGLMAGSLGTRSVDWLVGLAAELVADAGLIGVDRDQVAAMLERKAARAEPGTLLFHPMLADGCSPLAESEISAGLLGLAGGAGAYDLMRAIHEGLALSARHGHETLGHRPSELRLVARTQPSTLGRRLLAGAMGAPVRHLQRTRPATAGAALLSLVALGHYRRPAEGFATWVEPHLSAPEAVDPELHSVYDRLFEAYREIGPLPAKPEGDAR